MSCFQGLALTAARLRETQEPGSLATPAGCRCRISIFPSSEGGRRDTYTADTEVLAVDEDLVLLSAAERAENPRAAEEAATLGAGPAEVGGTGVDKTKRVVTSVVEADSNGVRREPSDLGVLEGTSDAVNVDLKRVLADLHIRSVGALQRLKSRELTVYSCVSSSTKKVGS